MRIVIDPGHGGPDPGAVGPSGTKEKTVVLPVAKKLAEILSSGAEVRLTRDGDSDVSLARRVEISNDAGTDIFISIHANAATNPLGRGIEVWTTIGQTDADPVAESIANTLRAAFPDMLFRSDLSDGDLDKEANFYVLRWTDAPAVLVELAFITNPAEETLLQSPGFQEKAARAIAEGVAGHLGITLPPADPDAVRILARGMTFTGRLVDGRVKLIDPIRPLAEALGHTVTWDEKNNLVKII